MDQRCRTLLCGVLAGAVSAAGLTACGTQHGPREVSVGRPASKVVVARERHSASPDGAQLLARSEAALRRVHSFYIANTATDGSGLVTASKGAFEIPNRFSIAYVHGATRYSFRLVGDHGYVKANARYWVSQGIPASRTASIAGVWIQEPAAALPLALRVLTSSRMLGRCLLGPPTSDVAVAKPPVSSGQWITLDEKSPAPSTTMDALTISATAPWLPILISQRGPDDPPNHACGDTPTSTAPGTSDILNIARYNQPVRITPPTHALTLGGVRRRISQAAVNPSAKGPLERTAEHRQSVGLEGTWLATGRIVSSQNFFGQGESVGTAVNRVWRIHSGCQSGVCATTLYRATDPGVLVGGLGWVGDHWAAGFDNTYTCSDGQTNPMSDQMTLSLVGSTLRAVETDRAGTECSPKRGRTVMDWTAHRTLAPAGSTATS